MFKNEIAEKIPPNWRVFEKSKIDELGIEAKKIDLLAPVVEDVDGSDESVYIKSLKGGVAHHSGTSLPGQGGNIFIFGHSSTETGIGRYAKVFERLGDLEVGDEVNIYHNRVKYTYTIFEKRVVAENNMSVLNETEDEQLTLMTCWPIGTDEKRLILKASPK